MKEKFRSFLDKKVIEEKEGYGVKVYTSRGMKLNAFELIELDELNVRSLAELASNGFLIIEELCSERTLVVDKNKFFQNRIKDISFWRDYCLLNSCPVRLNLSVREKELRIVSDGFIGCKFTIGIDKTNHLGLFYLDKPQNQLISVVGLTEERCINYIQSILVDLELEFLFEEYKELVLDYAHVICCN